MKRIFKGISTDKTGGLVQDKDPSGPHISAHHALQPDINSHSTSDDNLTLSKNIAMKNSYADFDDSEKMSARAFKSNQLKAEYGWDVYPD